MDSGLKIFWPGNCIKPTVEKLKSLKDEIKCYFRTILVFNSAVSNKISLHEHKCEIE